MKWEIVKGLNLEMDLEQVKNKEEAKTLLIKAGELFSKLEMTCVKKPKVVVANTNLLEKGKLGKVLFELQRYFPTGLTVKHISINTGLSFPEVNTCLSYLRKYKKAKSVKLLGEKRKRYYLVVK